MNRDSAAISEGKRLMEESRASRAKASLLRKADLPLQRALTSPDFDLSVALPVLLVVAARPLAPGITETSDRGRSAAASFEDSVRPLLEDLRRLGASDLQVDWISWSVALRGHLSVLEAAADRADVHQIVLDTPRNAMA